MAECFDLAKVSNNFVIQDYCAKNKHKKPRKASEIHLAGPYKVYRNFSDYLTITRWLLPFALRM
jgi:hypothetical protein